jgi:hypothetical protein
VLWAEKHIRLRKGYLFAVYVAAYTFGRFWIEYLRIDFAHKFLGLRLNDWVSIAIFAAAIIVLVTRGRPEKRHETGSADELESSRSTPVGPDEDEKAEEASDGPELAARSVAESADEVVPGPGDP